MDISEGNLILRSTNTSIKALGLMLALYESTALGHGVFVSGHTPLKLYFHMVVTHGSAFITFANNWFNKQNRKHLQMINHLLSIMKWRMHKNIVVNDVMMTTTSCMINSTQQGTYCNVHVQ